MKLRWEYLVAVAGVLLAVVLSMSTVGVGTYGTWNTDVQASELTSLVEAAGPQLAYGVPSMGADELAVELMAGMPGLTVVDVRAGAAPPEDLIPGAYWIPLAEPSWQDPGPFPEHRKLVLVDADEESAALAWRRAHALGYERAMVLAGGQPAWNDRYSDPQEPAEDASRADWDDYNQRKAVSLYLSGGVEALTNGASSGAPRPVAPPPMPVRQASSGPKAAEGC